MTPPSGPRRADADRGRRGCVQRWVSGLAQGNCASAPLFAPTRDARAGASRLNGTRIVIPHCRGQSVQHKNDPDCWLSPARARRVVGRLFLAQRQTPPASSQTAQPVGDRQPSVKTDTVWNPNIASSNA